jgi:hypothetical protein
MNAHRCEAETWKKKGPRPDRCTRRGVVFRSGKWYCCQHEPVAVAEPEAEQKMRAYIGVCRRENDE